MPQAVLEAQERKYKDPADPSLPSVKQCASGSPGASHGPRTSVGRAPGGPGGRDANESSPALALLPGRCAPAPLPLRLPHLVPLRSSPTSRRAPPPISSLASRKAETNFKNPVTRTYTTHANTLLQKRWESGERKKKEGKVKRPHSPAGRPPKLAKLAAPYPGGRRRQRRPPGGRDAVPREARRSAAGDEATGQGQVGWAPSLWRTEDPGSEGARRRCARWQP